MLTTNFRAQVLLHEGSFFQWVSFFRSSSFAPQAMAILHVHSWPCSYVGSSFHLQSSNGGELFVISDLESSVQFFWGFMYSKENGVGNKAERFKCKERGMVIVCMTSKIKGIKQRGFKNALLETSQSRPLFSGSTGILGWSSIVKLVGNLEILQVPKGAISGELEDQWR
ncbi:hypothetical protein BS78_08G016600 [Paspalum vaginatum]|nr:hypothetical protein BS78_08G016600 [Paspalum vaginatum]